MADQVLDNNHVWERWDWLWHGAAYGLLLLNSLLAVVNEARYGSLAHLLLLSALLAVWYAPFVPLPESFWTARLAWTAAYWLLGWALWAGLILLQPASLLLAGLFYPLLFIRLPVRRAIVGGVLLTVATMTLFTLGHYPDVHWPTILLIAILLMASSTLVGLFINALIQQSQERQRLVEALQTAQASLAEVEQERGILLERQRLAREIHDTLAQDFTSVIMHLTAAQLQLPHDLASAQQAVTQAETTARDGLHEARRLVWALQPSQLTEVSLAESIERWAQQWSEEQGITAVFTLTGDPYSLRPAWETTLFRAAQEALRNVEKHAQASQVNLTLSYMPGQVVLDAADDGRGFTPNDAAPVDPTVGGFGLRGMQERVERLGGTLTIESEPGQGTAVAIALPVIEET